ncbi:MAG: Fic family protein, partial [Acidimicrobiales bacterium]
ADAVADNVHVVVRALRSRRRRITVQDLHDWHRDLMGGDRRFSPEVVGAFRLAQSWIGGTSPRDAALVPPPAELVADLMDDLIAFVNDDSLDPVTQAAVAHAQFECLHPYADGNGRIGRVLFGWVLTHRLGIELPPPISVFIARDPGGYLSGLTLFRLGHLDAWVEWVSKALVRAGEAVTAVVTKSEEVQGQWRLRLEGLRDDSSAHQIIGLLAEHPVVTSALVANRLGVAERSARGALNVLATHGIVEPHSRTPSGPGRPRRYWVSRELLELVSGWPGAETPTPLQ